VAIFASSACGAGTTLMFKLNGDTVNLFTINNNDDEIMHNVTNKCIEFI